MFVISSSIENMEQPFTELNQALKPFGFVLGGNWDYDHGSFDYGMDESHKVWLRIPFQVTKGSLDGLQEEQNTIIQLGKPYVLKHVYQEGLDPEAEVNTYGALVNQFQKPADSDAEIEPMWIEKAKQVIAQIEQLFS